LLHDLLHKDGVMATITFAYGQSHYKEVIAAQRIAGELEVPWRLIDFTPVVGRGDNLLTGGKGSPVVVNRNATMLTLAVTYAAGIGSSAVFIAPTKEDYDLFPDCRPAFFKRFNRMLEIAEVPVHVETPYIHMTKRNVVSIGRKLNVDFDATWSCYRGGSRPCGECLACTTRKVALEG
jgi:7-cyano-7-deazaguanine synthase